MIILAIIAVIIIDQATKLWAVKCLMPLGEIPLIKDVLYFTYSRNDGAAFGMLDDCRWVFLAATVIIIAVISAFLIATRKKKKYFLFDFSLALILGGGISNMIDRIFFGQGLFNGSVIDFIDFRLINFAIFNAADSAVCIGEALLLIYVLFVDTKLDNKKYYTLDGGIFAKNGNKND